MNAAEKAALGVHAEDKDNGGNGFSEGGSDNGSNDNDSNSTRTVSKASYQ